jgi:endonuclease III
MCGRRKVARAEFPRLSLRGLAIVPERGDEMSAKRSTIEKREKQISAADLGIDLTSMREDASFRWFLACVLFGKPIQQEVARRTYQEFVKEGLTTPEAIIRAGWDKLVQVLDEGHYTRYDFSTATKLLDIMKHLQETYGTLLSLIEGCHSKEEISSRLQEFKGIGPKTAEIFLRDLPDSFSHT